MAAVVDQPADHRVGSEAKAPERRRMVLVVDLELRGMLQAAHDHVRAGPLQPDEEYWPGALRLRSVRHPPAPLVDRFGGPLHGVELVLLDEARQALRAQPPQMTPQ